MGLRITVPPKGKIIANGAVIENAGSSQMVLLFHNHAEVLRENHVMQPEQADTPVKRAYYAGQSLILADAVQRPEAQADFVELLEPLQEVFAQPEAARAVRDALAFARQGKAYKAISALRPAIAYERLAFAHLRAAQAAEA